MRYGMIIDLARCIGCNACTVACKSHNGTPKDIFWSQVLVEEKGEYPNARTVPTPILCMHCEDAPCVKVCPTGASYKDENGIVHVNQDKCIGCKSCMVACPYDARKFMGGNPKSYFPGKEVTQLEEVQKDQFPRAVVSKCNFCADRLKEDLLPACVGTCPAQARIFGDLDDPGSEVSKILVKKSGRTLLPHKGTKPSVYYLAR